MYIYVGENIKTRILAVLVLLLLLFSSVNVFGVATCTGAKLANCAGKTSASCPNYFSTEQGCGRGQCKYVAQCTNDPGADCKYATKPNTTTKCTALSEGVCESYCKPDTIDTLACNPCVWAIITCATETAAYCHIPEFFGIEFSEMQFSTGIIALIAAIALPSILFRKKEIGQGKALKNK
ncbi:MAG: hypothetical protein CL943_02395 [Candidatus Diapherotrites archaeon]|uniref:Uncharacterized protein n=1 Tax=Candidatus Iainarchaeum sp. TaxID=3101447 RepID=A0A2D6M142_9ARCH|nr:hypothetical protein [Candidatus Diapherotrites archaeon]|tara:strand:- start:3820 stop:4359 length:540 start_codon:yes stop_codon:yes gene_type:complete